MTRGILDTSVVIDMGSIPPDALPIEAAITALTLAELTAGPLATSDEIERARRLAVLQEVMEIAPDPLPFDEAAARAYGRVFASLKARGRSARGARAVDALIAAIAIANALPLYTRNPGDFKHIEDLQLVEV